MSNIFNKKTKAKGYNKSNIFEIKKYIKKFKIDDLKAEHDAQRTLDESWVQQIIETWDERACTPIVVVIENGENLIVDGQHRYMAMKELEYIEIECYVIEGLTASEAFLMINHIKPIEAIDKFVQKAKSETSFEYKIKNIFDEKDIRITTYSQNDYYYSDVEYLLSLEEDFSDLALDESLTLITQLLEYDGKISKQLLSKLYIMFKDCPEGYEKAFIYINKMKHRYLDEENLSSKKAINKLHKRFPKSRVDTELLKLF